MAIAAGTSNLYFSRDTKVYIAQGANIWEVPVLNGYAANQTTNTSEISLSEMSDSAGNSRRGRRVLRVEGQQQDLVRGIVLDLAHHIRRHRVPVTHAGIDTYIA